jgi:DNA-binding transcriptional regulator LsrR (DeoR family)
MSAPGAVIKAHIAQLHYVRGMSKRDIAARLGVSRFKVARLIDEAVADGIIRFEIDQAVDVDDGLSRALETAFGLDLAIVAQSGGEEDAPARAAAAWLPDLVHGIDLIGVSWGQTLQRVADALAVPQAPLDLAVVQICGAVPGLQPGVGPAETIHRFAERLGGRAYPLHAPALSSPAARAELADNPVIRPTVELFDRVDLAVIGIGHAQGFPCASPASAGHLLVHEYDEGGATLRNDISDVAIAMSEDQLRRTRVIAVAGGEAKNRAILGALRTGLINALFTDPRCASYALNARPHE